MKTFKAALLALSMLALSAVAAAQSTATPNVGFGIPAFQSTNWQVPINQNFYTLDSLLGGALMLTPATATPVISTTTTWITSNTAPSTITNFLGAFPGQTLRVICGSGDTFTNIDTSPNISVTANWNCSSNPSITFTLVGTVWQETGRAGGGGGGGSITGCPTGVTSQWIRTLSTSGSCARSQPAFTDLAGMASTGQIPTLNQNTTGTAGSAAKWITPRLFAGNSADGSANVPFANLFVMQGTSDTGVPNAQFLGNLGTGILKNTTATGILSNAASADVIGLFSGCSGTLLLSADGQCHPAGGAPAWAAITPGTNINGAFLFGAGSSLGTVGGGQILATTAQTWATIRNLAGNGVDGSANVPFANRFIVQGTSDAGLSGAQFMGNLGTGIVKNTTATGVQSIAAASDILSLFSGTCNSGAFLRGAGACGVIASADVPNNGASTSGNAATATALAATPTLCSAGNAPVGVLPNGNATGCAPLSGLPSPPTAPNNVGQQLVSTPIAGVGQAPAYSLPGLGVRVVSGTTATDTIASTDCAPSRIDHRESVANAVTLPTATTLAVPNCTFRIANDTTGTYTLVTVTPTTWSLNFRGQTGLTSIAIPIGSSAQFSVDPSGNSWDVDMSGPKARGRKALSTTAIASAACGTDTATATGAISGDTFSAGFSGDTDGVTGYIPSTAGMLSIKVFVTSNTMNFHVCNNTASPITPGAVSVDWSVN